MQTFFDYIADFAIYGTATLPILKDVTPVVEKVLTDVIGAGILGGRVITGFFGKIVLKFRRLF